MKASAPTAVTRQLAESWRLPADSYNLIRQWIGPHLEMHDLGHGSLPGFGVERGTGTPGGPHALPLPAGLGIVDASVHSFREEAERIRHAQYRELTVHQGKQRIGAVAGGDRRVFPQPQGIDLLDPVAHGCVGAAG